VFVPQPDSLDYSVFKQPDGGSCNGSASLVLGGANGPFSIVWNDLLNQTGPSAVDLCGGVYTATVTDGNGCVYAIEVEIAGGTNALASTAKNSVSLSPNPAQDFIALKGFENLNGISYECLSVLGARCELKLLNQNDNGITLDVSNLTRGVYILKVSTSDELFTFRFIRK
jgi:hypothetical protein